MLCTTMIFYLSPVKKQVKNGDFSWTGECYIQIPEDF